jgi:hypothetical protein
MRFVKKFQQGGPMPADPAMDPAMAGGAPAEGGQNEMMAQIEQMAMEIIQSIGPEGAAMLAETIMAMLQQGGGAPQGEQPVFRKGGRIIGYTRK